MMNYLYIGYYTDNQTFEKIVNRKINNMSVARQKFEYNIIRGLKEHLKDEIEFVSYVPVDQNLHIAETCVLGDVSIRQFALIKNNLCSFFRQMTRFKRWLLSHNREQLNGLKIIMYALNPLFLIPLLSLRKKYGFQLITICSELPQLRRYGNSMPAKIKRKLFSYLNQKFDKYVLFSKQMAGVVGCNSDNSIVVEGIAPDIECYPQKHKKNIVMYAGGMAKDNNIAKLVECCMEIQEIDEVWICGDGEDAEAVKRAQAKDDRIKFLGRVDNQQVLALERKAKLLVNLRSSSVELTKYSFPSKILEYISSGSLVLSTRLQGIPEEYFDYILGTSEEKNEIIAAIKRCLVMSDEEYIAKCKAAQDFITKQKNYLVQAKKIVDFTDRH